MFFLSNTKPMDKILTFVFFCLFAACTNKPSPVEMLEKDVMQIHDDVMPKMADIHQSRKRLQIALEQGADSTQVFDLLRDLDEADEAMMVWMNEYQPLRENVEESIKISYFKNEKTKIEHVEELISNSISAVDSFTKSFVIQSDTL